MTKYSVNHRIYLSSFGTQRPAADAARSRQAISMMGLLTFVIKNPITSASIAVGWVAVGYAGYYAYKTGSWISWATSPKTYIKATENVVQTVEEIVVEAAQNTKDVTKTTWELLGKRPQDFTEVEDLESPEEAERHRRVLRTGRSTVIVSAMLGISYWAYSYWSSTE